MFVPDHNMILFNQEWVVVLQVEVVILTALHETRHAYQKVQIDGRLNMIIRENPETITKWKQEFGQYFRPSDQFPNDQDIRGKKSRKTR
jgi:hypothetical protein